MGVMYSLRVILGIVPGSPFRTFMLGYYALMGLALIASIGIYLAGIDPLWSLIVLLPIAIAPIVVPVVALVSYSYLGGMRQLLAGKGWARWEYSPEEWRRFADAEWARARREARLGPLYTLLLAAGIGGFFGFLARDVSVGLALAGIIGVAGLITSAGIWLAGRWRYRRRDQPAGAVLVGPDGIFSRGQYTAFDAFNLHLQRVEVEPGDPATLLVVTASRTDYGSTRSYETRVPVPSGHEPEAIEIAERLRALHPHP